MDGVNTNNNGISIIVPFLNEKEAIEKFCNTLDVYASGLDFEVELIFVDDGSTDDTVEKIRSYNFNNIQSVRVLRLSRNFGMHSAIRAGLKHASRDICTWMGSDLQEPLELLPESYKRIMEGYDAVYIDKKTVGVGRFNRLFSKFYSFLMRKYAVSSYTEGGTSVIVFNSKIKDYLNANIESNSSIMLQIMDIGFKHCTISMDFGRRKLGRSKWSLAKKIKLFIDSFVAFSFMPIRLVSIVGIIMFMIGIVDGITIVGRYLMGVKAPVGYPTIACLLVLGFGITNISLGIIAEYLWRTYDAARNRPEFIIAEEIIVKD